MTCKNHVFGDKSNARTRFPFSKKGHQFSQSIRFKAFAEKTKDRSKKWRKIVAPTQAKRTPTMGAVSAPWENLHENDHFEGQIWKMRGSY